MNADLPLAPPFNPTSFVVDLQPDSRDEVVLRGGDRVAIRPVQIGDVELERAFIQALSPASRRFRFLDSMAVPSEALLKQLTVLDPSSDAAFVAVTGEGRDEKAVGVGRFSAVADGHDCEFAVSVADDWQQKGLGTLLMRRLIGVAKARGIARMHSSDPIHNVLMRQFAARLHLHHVTDPVDPTLVLYSVDLMQDSTLVIELTQEYEVSNWCHSLSCTENELKAAIATVGNSAERVREYLRGRRHAPY